MCGYGGPMPTGHFSFCSGPASEDSSGVRTIGGSDVSAGMIGARKAGKSLVHGFVKEQTGHEL